MLLKYNKINDESLRLAASQFEHRKYEEGSLILQEGEESSHFYVIIKGSVVIKKFKKARSTYKKQ
jgi:CRP-like cAMP-binding protein